VRHLFPIRLLLTIFALVALFAYAFGLRMGLVSTETWSAVATGVLKIATPAAVCSMVLALVVWRMAPRPLQNLIFPYLGGIWSGEIEFLANGQTVQRPATLEVTHTLTSIHFALSTVESTSETLLVHARKVPVQSDQVKLVYIYEVVRREGFLGAGDRYRGCAFIDVSLAKPHTLIGSYMAGAARSGSIRMTLTQPTPWWKVWR
jgi:hypothetical protein